MFACTSETYIYVYTYVCVDVCVDVCVCVCVRVDYMRRHAALSTCGPRQKLVGRVMF